MKNILSDTSNTKLVRFHLRIHEFKVNICKNKINIKIL